MHLRLLVLHVYFHVASLQLITVSMRVRSDSTCTKNQQMAADFFFPNHLLPPVCFNERLKLRATKFSRTLSWWQLLCIPHLQRGWLLLTRTQSPETRQVKASLFFLVSCHFIIARCVAVAKTACYCTVPFLLKLGTTRKKKKENNSWRVVLG